MEGESTGLFLGVSPSSLALIFIIILLCIWIAWNYYKGGATVPSPAYASGFVGGQTAGPRIITSGQRLKAKKANKYTATKPAPLSAATKAQMGPMAPSVYKQGFRSSSENPSVQDEWPANIGYEIKDKKALAQAPNIDSADRMERTGEGFFGGVAKGSGSPDCSRSSLEGAQLIAFFQDIADNQESTVEQGSEDLRELTQIVGKLSCFKKDLVSPAYIVNMTRSQQFVTMHDIEPIAETTGRCFSKTISPRDLEIAFDKWSARGELLIRRLCTAYRLQTKDVNTAEELFRALIRDIKDIARSSCLQGEPTIAGKPGPRDPHPYQSPGLIELGEYSGYY